MGGNILRLLRPARVGKAAQAIAGEKKDGEYEEEFSVRSRGALTAGPERHLIADDANEYRL